MELEPVLQHLSLVLISSLFSAILGLSLGIVAFINKKMAFIILWTVDILQTIPVLALLGLIMIISGATSTTVIIGIVLYSLLPVVRNTLVGLKSIDPSIKEAAIGMGMSKLQCLYKVEIPMAFPYIFTGFRIALVTSIGIAVFGAVVGGGGLGATINQAILRQDKPTIYKATLILMCMSIIFDIILGFIEKKLYIKGAHR